MILLTIQYSMCLIDANNSIAQPWCLVLLSLCNTPTPTHNFYFKWLPQLTPLEFFPLNILKLWTVIL